MRRSEYRLYLDTLGSKVGSIKGCDASRLHRVVRLWNGHALYLAAAQDGKKKDDRCVALLQCTERCTVQYSVQCSVWCCVSIMLTRSDTGLREAEGDRVCTHTHTPLQRGGNEQAALRDTRRKEREITGWTQRRKTKVCEGEGDSDSKGERERRTERILFETCLLASFPFWLPAVHAAAPNQSQRKRREKKKGLCSRERIVRRCHVTPTSET